MSRTPFSRRGYECTPKRTWGYTSRRGYTSKQAGNESILFLGSRYLHVVHVSSSKLYRVAFPVSPGPDIVGNNSPQLASARFGQPHPEPLFSVADFHRIARPERSQRVRPGNLERLRVLSSEFLRVDESRDHLFILRSFFSPSWALVWRRSASSSRRSASFSLRSASSSLHQF